jgi:hypothetical protein
MLLFSPTMRMTVSQEPDIRPILCLLIDRFRETGLSAMAAGELALGLVLDDIMRATVIEGLDMHVTQRLTALDDILKQLGLDELALARAIDLSQKLQRRMRIAMWLMCGLGTLWLLLLIERLWLQ